jgi:hypothetical protein
MLIKLPKIMPTHQATFINDEFKNGYMENEPKIIVSEHTIEGKLRVTSKGPWPDPSPILYNKDEDFHKDWKILSTQGNR